MTLRATDHHPDCEWHHDQYPHECGCGVLARYICTHAGSTLLVSGRAYTIKDRSYDHFGCEMWEMNECPGFLFGPWRFEVVADEDPLSERAVREHWDVMFRAIGFRHA